MRNVFDAILIFPYLILDQKIYCLMKKSNVINDRMSFYDIRMEPINYEVRLQPLIRFPWNRTWIKRIDYMENILNHLESKLEKLFKFLYQRRHVRDYIIMFQKMVKN